jgi:phosphatidylglycerophosphatase A
VSRLEADQSEGDRPCTSHGAASPHDESRLRRLAVLALATAGGAGFAPVAPGTFGSLVGVGVYALLAPLGALAVALAAGVASGLGVWSAGEAERLFARSDDGRIVIDEVAGQLVALWPLALLAPPGRALAPLPLCVGFLAFRALDVAKPGPVRWAERRFHGGAGVMLDDLVAGALAAAVVAGAVLAGAAS